ncbi:hypothetical protein GF312_01540 [Candidatus Poribacteria bacterium]|nr:hypothetical protein [Candidatus Poribacteria bacterium]
MLEGLLLVFMSLAMQDWEHLQVEGTGFFRTEEIDGVWWLVDPSGKAFISKGVNHVTFRGDHSPALGRSPYHDFVSKKYESHQDWAETVVERMKGWGFNTIGAWSDSETYVYDMAYTPILNIGANAGGDWRKGVFPDVFSEKFREAAEASALKDCAPRRDDPMLLGYFIDNELRWAADWRSENDLFDDFLAFPAGSPGKNALMTMLKGMYENIDGLNKSWQTEIGSFDDIEKASSLSELGVEFPSPEDQKFAGLPMPKPAAKLYLNQTYGSLQKVNEVYNTNASSYDELLTKDFLIKLSEEIQILNLPREFIIMGLEMIYGNLEKVNKAFETDFNSYDELIDAFYNKPSGESPVVEEIKKVESKFLEKVAEQYFKVCNEAIKKYDPNHLILGCRFAGYAPTEVVKAMKNYVDVVSYNNYSKTAPLERLEEIYKITGKPIMLTEFSFKAMDSGLPNTKGAGSPVETQQDRADLFDGYVTALMEQPYMVGFHWFEHADEPAEGRFDGENSNYGLVNIKDETWEILTSRMKEVNAKIEKIHINSGGKE